MRKTALFIVGLLAIINFGLAQSNIHYYGWDTTYSYYPSDIIQTQDGGFLIIGDVNWSGPFIENFYHRRYLVRTDSNGDTLWTSLYLQPFFGSAKVIETPSNDFVAFGHISGGYMCGLVGSGIPFTHYCLQSYSSSGDSLSTVKYDDNCNNSIADFVKNSSGGMSALMRFSDLSANSTYAIKEISSSGIISTIPISTNYMSLLEEADNGYWLGKWTLLSKVSAIGDSLWENPMNLYPVPTDFCKVGGDSLVFVGTSSTIDTMSVFKTDSFGNLGWTKQYPFRGSEIMLHSSGNYIITGSDNGNVKVLTLNANGDSLWSKTYPLTLAGAGIKTIETDDGLATLAYSGGFGEMTQYVLILDTTNSLTSVESNNISDGNNVRIYPNPNNGQFTVEITNPQAVSLQLRVLNILGQEIFAEKLVSFGGVYKERIGINKPNAGVYILQLINDKGVINKQVIVK